MVLFRLVFLLLSSYISLVSTQQHSVPYLLTLKGMTKSDIDNSSILQYSLRVALSTVLNLPVSNIGTPTVSRLPIDQGSEVSSYVSSQKWTESTDTVLIHMTVDTSISTTKERRHPPGMPGSSSLSLFTSILVSNAQSEGRRRYFIRVQQYLPNRLICRVCRANRRCSSIGGVNSAFGSCGRLV